MKEDGHLGSRDLFALFRYHPDYLQDSPEYLASITDNFDVSRQIGPSRIYDCRKVVLDGGNAVQCGSKVVMTMKVIEVIVVIVDNKLGTPANL